MTRVEVEFKGHRKGIFSNPQEFPLEPKDRVIVQADRGIDIGVVSLTGPERSEILSGDKELEEYEPILRKASESDIQADLKNRHSERDARLIFIEEVKMQHLEMKLVDAEFQVDRRKLTFYFTADGRVDFRDLVKKLAQHFKTRIDLRQIGARDEAKRLGGIGLCGRELCCASFIREFKPVTTSMLKEQNLLLNPQKNTGLCGKLRCCLRYEVDQYREANFLFPKLEIKVTGPRGEGMVEKVNLCTCSCGITWTDGCNSAYSYEQLRENSNWDPEKRDEITVIEFHSDPTLVEARADAVLVATSEEPAIGEAEPGRPYSHKEERKPVKSKKHGKRRGRRGSRKRGAREEADGKRRNERDRREAAASSETAPEKTVKPAGKGGKGSGQRRDRGKSSQAKSPAERPAKSDHRKKGKPVKGSKAKQVKQKDKGVENREKTVDKAAQTTLPHSAWPMGRRRKR